MNENTVTPENADDHELTVAESFELLDKIAAELEKEDTGIEESFRLYQQGMNLLKDVSGRIENYEKKMQILNDDGEIGEFR